MSDILTALIAGAGLAGIENPGLSDLTKRQPGAPDPNAPPATAPAPQVFRSGTIYRDLWRFDPMAEEELYPGDTKPKDVAEAQKRAEAANPGLVNTNPDSPSPGTESKTPISVVRDKDGNIVAASNTGGSDHAIPSIMAEGRMEDFTPTRGGYGQIGKEDPVRARWEAEQRAEARRAKLIEDDPSYPERAKAAEEQRKIDAEIAKFEAQQRAIAARQIAVEREKQKNGGIAGALGFGGPTPGASPSPRTEDYLADYGGYGG